MRLVQFRRPDGHRAIGHVTDDDRIVDITAQLSEFDTTLRLLRHCLDSDTTVDAWAAKASLDGSPAFPLDDLPDEAELLSPLDQPDNPWALQLWGAGITHRRSADAREEEALEASGDRASIYDRLYRAGVEGGRPAAGEVGSKPEIFFKANGHQVAAPGAPLEAAGSAERLAPEPEVVAFFLPDAKGMPRLVGFTGGNDFSDQGWESENPLYLPHAKVQDRLASFGPILVTPEDPRISIDEIAVHCRVFRGAETVLDSGDLKTGERHMAHSLQNLTAHLFDHRQLREDEVRGLFLGTSAVFKEAVRAGDRIEIAYDSGLGTLRNPVIEA